MQNVRAVNQSSSQPRILLVDDEDSFREPLMIGLATAFASSFAHMFIIGTPNNAIAYSMAKDPETGEQLVTLKDFLVHGSAVLCLSFAVLWLWVFFGYWRWIGF